MAHLTAASFDWDSCRHLALSFFQRRKYALELSTDDCRTPPGTRAWDEDPCCNITYALLFFISNIPDYKHCNAVATAHIPLHRRNTHMMPSLELSPRSANIQFVLMYDTLRLPRITKIDTPPQLSKCHQLLAVLYGRIRQGPVIRELYANNLQANNDPRFYFNPYPTCNAKIFGKKCFVHCLRSICLTYPG